MGYFYYFIITLMNGAKYTMEAGPKKADILTSTATSQFKYYNNTRNWNDIYNNYL